MKLIWKVTRREARDIAAFVCEHENNAFVRARIERYVKGGHAHLTKTVVW